MYIEMAHIHKVPARSENCVRLRVACSSDCDTYSSLFCFCGKTKLERLQQLQVHGHTFLFIYFNFFSLFSLLLDSAQSAPSFSTENSEFISFFLCEIRFYRNKLFHYNKWLQFLCEKRRVSKIYVSFFQLCVVFPLRSILTLGYETFTRSHHIHHHFDFLSGLQKENS